MPFIHRSLCYLFFLMGLASSVLASSAQDTLEEYLAASKALDLEKAYELISSKDKKFRSFETFKEKNGPGSAPINTAAFLSQMSFKVLSVDEQGKTANAKVQVEMPNLMALMGEMFSLAMANAFGADQGKDIEKQMATLINEKVASKSLPMMTDTKSYQLINETDGWKLFLDWEGEEKKKQNAKRKTEAAQFALDARSLKLAKDLPGAIAKYKQALKLYPEDASYQESISELEAEIRLQKAQRDYISEVRLYDLQAKEFESYSGKKKGVSFKLQNKGDRSLQRIKVVVYFQDKNGTTIFEKDFTPVTKYETPLKPNYIWTLGDKLYTLDNIPDEWEVGLVTAEVTKIEFSDDEQ